MLFCGCVARSNVFELFKCGKMSRGYGQWERNFAGDVLSLVAEVRKHVL